MKKEKQKILLGCVADDFTGAGDIASFLRDRGLRTLLVNGIPAEDEKLPDNLDAVVLALKSRTQQTSQAVADSLESFDWLRNQGAETLYFKYCSTFDSTPEGNIGPVIDGVLERYSFPYTIVCPSLLVNKRTVKEGILYVDGVPLSESPMRHHPLTPMWESDLVKLLVPQSKYPCYKITASLLERPAEVRELIKGYLREHDHFILCVDFYEWDQGEKIIDLFGELPFLTGGSGLAEQVALHCHQKKGNEILPERVKPGRRILLAGSCSVATRRQVQRFLDAGGKAFMVDPVRLLRGELTREKIWEWIESNGTEDVLIYSSGSVDQNRPFQIQQGEEASYILEETLAALGKQAVEAGINKLVAAGGEVSGAVVQALGYGSFYLEKTIAPGIPIIVPPANPDLSIVLKSGNFGGEDFFNTVLKEEEAHD